MPEKKTKERMKKTLDRESKILNVMLNTSILLMTLMTDAFTDAFAGMASGMAQAVAAGVEGSDKTPAPEEAVRRIKTEFPKQMMKQVLQMKTDMKKQLSAKNGEIKGKIADPKFDAGIAIAERYNLGVPNLTNDLDERSLLCYIALLKTNDTVCTKMFQELMEWMKSVNE